MVIDKTLINSFAHSTERAAYGASIFKGKNNKLAADQGAVDEMRKVLNKIDMASDEEINKKINIFSKKIKKKIYTISTLKHKGLSAIKRLLVSYVH